MQGIPKENKGFQVPVVHKDSAKSQKNDLKWTSIWRAKCKEFHGKNEGFRVPVVLRDSAKAQKMDLK